uniref:imm11 family protein n=1 Tax=Stappia sp. TaxID=1870903 RepID=UPI003BA9DC04
MVWMIELEYQDRGTPRFALDPFEDSPSPSNNFGFSRGYWVDPARQPRSGQQTTRKKIPDIFPLPGLNAVRQRFKDLVEEFEPGVHQFMPLVLRDKDGKQIDDQFYVFNCTVSFDAILVREMGLEPVQEGKEPPDYHFYSHNKIFVSRPRIEGHHLWMGHHLRPVGTWVFISDELHSEMKNRKIRYFKEEHPDVLDVPWRAEEQIKPILDWEASHPVEQWTAASRIEKELKGSGARSSAGAA